MSEIEAYKITSAQKEITNFLRSNPCIAPKSLDDINSFIEQLSPENIELDDSLEYAPLCTIPFQYHNISLQTNLENSTKAALENILSNSRTCEVFSSLDDQTKRTSAPQVPGFILVIHSLVLLDGPELTIASEQSIKALIDLVHSGENIIDDKGLSQQPFIERIIIVGPIFQPNSTSSQLYVDHIISRLSAGCIPVDIMPGLVDATSILWPQRPFPQDVLPLSAAQSTIMACSNPYNFEHFGINIYCINHVQGLNGMKRVLKTGHARGANMNQRASNDVLSLPKNVHTVLGCSSEDIPLCSNPQYTYTDENGVVGCLVPQFATTGRVLLLNTMNLKGSFQYYVIPK